MSRRWRVGTKVGRTVYERRLDGTEHLIGVMDRVEDAVLASAAPDLLEALATAGSVMCNADCEDEHTADCQQAQAAIAKATGPWSPTR